jgi:hypothetical protein
LRQVVQGYADWRKKTWLEGVESSLIGSAAIWEMSYLIENKGTAISDRPQIGHPSISSKADI